MIPFIVPVSCTIVIVLLPGVALVDIRKVVPPSIEYTYTGNRCLKSRRLGWDGGWWCYSSASWRSVFIIC